MNQKLFDPRISNDKYKSLDKRKLTQQKDVRTPKYKTRIVKP